MSNAPDKYHLGIKFGKPSGVARILKRGSSDHAGMAIVVDHCHVITCAHVVNVALGREKSCLSPPEYELSIEVDFPFEPGTVLRATIEKWVPMDSKLSGDVAILRVNDLIPRKVGIAIFSEIEEQSTDTTELSVFGIAGGEEVGNHVNAMLMGMTTSRWFQLEGRNSVGAFIEGGFSGAAVWNVATSSVLGMVVAKRISATEKVAYMIPTEILRSYWPTLNVERHNLSNGFSAIFSVYSAALFVLLFAHWATDRGIETLSFATFSGTVRPLAAFWGMHIYAFLVPWSLIMLANYAKAFRLHEWWMRLPTFGRLHDLSPIKKRKLTSVIIIISFIVLPFIAQIHFLRQFHKPDNGVYVYPGSFGYTTTELLERKEICFGPTQKLCTLQGAGLYSLGEPKSGFVAEYWDNAYRFGDLSTSDEASVTYFPILQPLLILLFTMFSAILSITILIRIFRRSHLHKIE